MSTSGLYVPPPLADETHGTAGVSDNLLAAGAGVYVALAGMSILLPEPGRYLLSADVRASIGGTPPVNAFVTARLFNVTAGAALPNSARIVTQANAQAPAVGDFADQSTAPIHEILTVTAPTTIRLEAAHFVTSGTVTVSNSVNSLTAGRNRLGYERIAL